jgi:hypothetical protein
MRRHRCAVNSDEQGGHRDGRTKISARVETPLISITPGTD